MEKHDEQFIKYLLDNPDKIEFDPSDPAHCLINKMKIRIGYGNEIFNDTTRFYPLIIYNSIESIRITEEIRDKIYDIFQDAKDRAGSYTIKGFVNKYCNH